MSLRAPRLQSDGTATSRRYEFSHTRRGRMLKALGLRLLVLGFLALGLWSLWTAPEGDTAEVLNALGMIFTAIYWFLLLDRVRFDHEELNVPGPPVWSGTEFLLAGCACFVGAPFH